MDNETAEKLSEIKESNSTIEPPEGLGTQVEMINDPKWNGVPPVGNRPISNRWLLIGFIIIVFLVKIVIWSGYRYASGNWAPLQDPVNNYWASLFAKPILQLVPLILLWWFLFKEKGWPFKFTRKNLFSSIIFGCLGGLLFYFVSSGIYIAQLQASGQATDFVFVAGWNDTSWALIIAMMFSYMISTGPAEELFSRGFLQDQTARAFPIIFAFVFSAILFAIGHLPISIFMHEMSFIEIFWYMASLIVMGLFFSIIYQWSRNIVLPIIIHGLWDWYLSLFSLKGAYTVEFVANARENFGMIDFVNTLLTLAVMLPIFYIIYRVWWRYDTPTEGPLGGIIRWFGQLKMTNWIRKRDHGDWPQSYPVIVTGGIVGIFCLLMIPTAAVIGTNDSAKFGDRIIGETGGELIIIYNNTTITDSQILNEGNSIDYPIQIDEMQVAWINVTIYWSDEQDVDFRHVNQPDTFQISLLDQDGNELDSTQGSAGELTISWAGEEQVEYSGTFSVSVTLIDAGDQEPILIFGRPIPDNSNNFNIHIESILFRTEYSGVDAGDVRWGT
jgi:membrane protease YdiL (CAAX protease family)